MLFEDKIEDNGAYHDISIEAILNFYFAVIPQEVFRHACRPAINALSRASSKFVSCVLVMLPVRRHLPEIMAVIDH